MLSYSNAAEVRPKAGHFTVWTGCCYKGFQPLTTFAARVSTDYLGQMVYMKKAPTPFQSEWCCCSSNSKLRPSCCQQDVLGGRGKRCGGMQSAGCPLLLAEDHCGHPSHVLSAACRQQPRHGIRQPAARAGHEQHHRPGHPAW
eukprot:GHRQ01034682.1.p1 GENE.GHRQ01034682.1~~GHRQ01034682.1.p1  ORF type:complete len:143 (-),score=45.07 GHRQ01034682.1:36-464(-)